MLVPKHPHSTLTCISGAQNVHLLELLAWFHPLLPSALILPLGPMRLSSAQLQCEVPIHLGGNIPALFCLCCAVRLLAGLLIATYKDYLRMNTIQAGTTHASSNGPACSAMLHPTQAFFIIISACGFTAGSATSSWYPVAMNKIIERLERCVHLQGCSRMVSW